MSQQSVKKHILVIEDNLGDFVLIEDYLHEEHAGISLCRATTFLEAKQHLTSKADFDAVLLDLSLPDVDVRELLVRDIVALSGKTPVIVLTGYADKEFGMKTLSLGISDYLSKNELYAAQLSKSIFYSIERKKVETQLMESEKKYRNLFDSSPLPKWVLDGENLRFLSVNEAAIELYGYSREEFLKMTVRDLWVEDGREEIEKTWRKNIDERFNAFVRHYKKNQEIIHVELKSTPIEFEGIKARVSLINDITARLEAEQALKQSERRFKALVQDASDLVLIMDYDGNLSYVSPSAKAVTGISAESFQKKNLYQLIHEDDVDSVKSCMLQLENKKSIQIPSYRIRTSEESRWIETIVTNLFDDPAVNGIVANCRDITDFVKQERKLLESLQRYDTVAKATSDTITDYDVQNDRMQFNEGIQKMFGYDLVHVKREGSWWDDKIHPEDKEIVKARTEEVFTGKNNQLQLEYRFRCADGTYKYVLDRSYLLKNENGKPLRMIGSIQDMTEIQNYIQTIEDHNARLKEIAWTQSHVVRAPLARIMGLIDLLENHDDLENPSQLLGHILSSARELDGIVRKISNTTEKAVENSI